MVEPAVLEKRRARMVGCGADAWKPLGRNRKVSRALQAYALLTTSAARGAVRDLGQVGSRT
jgi:dihydroxy-acid dehydratase